MGTLFILADEEVSVRINDKGGTTGCVEVVDCCGIPEIRIGPIGASHQGWTAEFRDWKQYEKFVDAVNDLHSRLSQTK